MELSNEFGLTLGGVIASIAGAYALLRGRLTNLEKDTGGLAKLAEKNADAIHALERDFDKLGGRVERVEELKASTLTRELFEERTFAQDREIKALRNETRETKEILKSKQSIAGIPRVVPRVDPPSDPPQLGPMRPRLPSRRDE